MAHDPAEMAIQAIKDALADKSVSAQPAPEPWPDTEQYLKLRDEALRSMGFW